MRDDLGLDAVRAYVVTNRGEARVSLLRQVQQGIVSSERTAALEGALVVLWLRELDGDKIVARATVAMRQRGMDASWVPVLLVWYRRRYLRLIEGPEE